MLLTLYLCAILIILLYLFAIAPGNSSDQKRQPFFGRTYAHRGLFTADQSVPENSMAAFEAAADAGYGVTADLQLTADRRVVVFNDSSLKRMCGVDGKTAEYTYAQLAELSLAGTGETIPLFSDLLALADGRMPVIVYLRSGFDNEILCKTVGELIVAYGGPVAVASFSPAIIGWFRDHAATKQLFRGILSAPRDSFPKGNDAHFFLVSHCMLNSVSRPQFILWPDVPRNLSVRASMRFGAVTGTSVAVGEEAVQAAMAKDDIVVFEGCRPAPFFKEQEDLARAAAEFEARRKNPNYKQDELIDTYLAATVEEDAQEAEAAAQEAAQNEAVQEEAPHAFSNVDIDGEAFPEGDKRENPGT